VTYCFLWIYVSTTAANEQTALERSVSLSLSSVKRDKKYFFILGYIFLLDFKMHYSSLINVNIVRHYWQTLYIKTNTRSAWKKDWKTVVLEKHQSIRLLQKVSKEPPPVLCHIRQHKTFCSQPRRSLRDTRGACATCRHSPKPFERLSFSYRWLIRRNRST